MEKVDILSLDGGGSRGIMEVAILEDVMRLATILWQDPTSLEYLSRESEKALEDPENVKRLIGDLDAVRVPIHPTDVYDMIVGTSTGGLISFGLVGGKTGEHGERLPMTLKECTQLYLDKTQTIFRKSFGHSLLSCLPFLGRLVPYSPDNVQKVVDEQFQGCRLGDLKDAKCVAGAVARKIGENECLVLFDTKNDIYSGYKTAHVLLATSNAPVYFKTPIRIGSDEFVDGGVGGNCPLAQAVPRAKEIFLGAKVRSTLSVAPPAPKEKSIPTKFQISYWINYFVNESTDGQAVYREAKKRHKSTKFRRLAPRGDRLKTFKLDEVNANGMLTAMNQEKLHNHLFLVDVVATATAVVDTYLEKSKTSEEATVTTAARLAHLMGKVYAGKREYEKAEDTYDTALNLWRKGSNVELKKIAIAQVHDDIGDILIAQAMFEHASHLYRTSVDRWRSIYGEMTNHSQIATALYKLGIALHMSNLFDEAHTNYRLALEMQRHIYAKDKASCAQIAATLNHIGRCYRGQEKFQKAIECLNEALDLRRELYHNKDNLDLAKTVNTLGICQMELQNCKEGEKNLKESFYMRQQLLKHKKDHPAIAASLNNLGWCFMLQQKYELAEDYIQRALKMFKRHHANKDHSSTAATLTNFARLKLCQEEYNTAIEYAEQSIAMYKCLGGAESLTEAKALNIIGKCFRKEGKFALATKYLTNAVKGMERIFHHGSYPTLADALVDLGECLFSDGKYSQAKSNFEYALKMRRDIERETAIILEYLTKCSEKLDENAGNATDNVENEETKVLEQKRLLH